MSHKNLTYIHTHGDATVDGQVISGPSPAWASYTSVFEAFKVNVNSFPTSGLFGANTAGITEAIAGMVEIPSTVVAINHSTGLAGYARTASSAQGAVGCFGSGALNSGGQHAWGSNFLVTNSPQAVGATNTGFNFGGLWGSEIDVNLFKTGGAAPTGDVAGLAFFGASEIQNTGALRAIDIHEVGINTSPVTPWKHGLYTGDAAATVGISLGALLAGATQPSQTLEFRSTSGASATLSSTINSLADGGLLILPQSGQVVLRNDAAGAQIDIEGLVNGGYNAWAFGGAPFYQGIRVNGTRASPTKVLSGETIFQYKGFGQYDTTVGHISAQAGVTMNTTEDWAAGARGCNVNVSATPTGSTTETQVWTMTGGGSLVMVQAGGNVDLALGTGRVMKFPTDNTDPTGGGGAATGRIAIDIGGALKYLAYY